MTRSFQKQVRLAGKTTNLNSNPAKLLTGNLFPSCSNLWTCSCFLFIWGDTGSCLNTHSPCSKGVSTRAAPLWAMGSGGFSPCKLCSMQPCVASTERKKHHPCSYGVRKSGSFPQNRKLDFILKCNTLQKETLKFPIITSRVLYQIFLKNQVILKVWDAIKTHSRW